ncbi:RsmB/NOP family class I SAM-dependent RNA methyltransferase [Candidatus Bathyarchaeota archaeon]|nr:RsmB/NOP family class I SAM-dependent RNA methyltransferase [Candidatus Bathyarchaeota archaeon]
MSTIERAFKIAVKALTLEERTGLSLKSTMDRARRILSESERQPLGLAYRLVFEVVKRKALVDHILDKVLGDSILKVSETVKQTMRLLVYEFKLNPTRSLRTSETLRALRRVLNPDDYRLCVRLLAKLRVLPLETLLPESGSLEYLSVLTSNPRWFVEYVLRVLGPWNGLRFLKSLLDAPSTYLRINTLKASEDETLRFLKEEGVRLMKVKDLKHVYKVESFRRPIVASSLYRRGLVYIQDLSSCLAVEASGVKPGFTVVDVCAAPGAKTSYLAQLMDNTGLIVSIELSRERAGLWLREVSRMGVSNAYLVLTDASRAPPLKLEADLVLIDPPCSGTGVFHRNPSIKWRMDLKDVRKFSELQLSMLLSYADLVKPGGHIVYSTCSITVEENEMVVEKFLNLNPDFEIVPLTGVIGEPGLRGFKECRRLYPHLHGCNGFFIAKLVRATV